MVTRNNYEEYFMLYVDNELSPAERKAVDIFVQQNTDLQKELIMLQQVKLNPEKILFEGKEVLLKQVVTEGFINHTNYEEYFLLYTDNELDEATKKQVEEFAAQDISLQEELSIYLQTRVEPDTDIIFEGKDSLYKKEESNRRVILPWYRIAAAAIVLLVAGFLVFNKTKTAIDNSTATNNPTVPVDTVQSIIQPGNKKDNLAVTIPATDSLHSKEHNNKQSLADNNNSTDKMQSAKNIRKVIAPVKNNDQQIAKTNIKQVTNKTVIKQDVIDPSVAQNDNKKTVDVAVLNTPSTNDNIIPSNDNKSANRNAVTSQPNYVAQQVASDAISDDLDPENKDFSSSQEESPKKNKIRGFLRKVSRVFEKTANAGNTDGSNRVSIGGFQIAQR